MALLYREAEKGTPVLSAPSGQQQQQQHQRRAASPAAAVVIIAGGAPPAAAPDESRRPPQCWTCRPITCDLCWLLLTAPAVPIVLGAAQVVEVKNVLPGECTLQHTAGLDATTGGRQGDDSICGEAVDSQTKNLEGQAVSDSRWFARMDAKFSGTTVQDRSCGYKGMLQDERTHCENWVRGEMRRLLEPGAEPLVVPCSLVTGNVDSSLGSVALSAGDCVHHDILEHAAGKSWVLIYVGVALAAALLVMVLCPLLCCCRGVRTDPLTKSLDPENVRLVGCWRRWQWSRAESKRLRSADGGAPDRDLADTPMIVEALEPSRPFSNPGAATAIGGLVASNHGRKRSTTPPRAAPATRNAAGRRGGRAGRGGKGDKGGRGGKGGRGSGSGKDRWRGVAPASSSRGVARGVPRRRTSASPGGHGGRGRSASRSGGTTADDVRRSA